MSDTLQNTGAAKRSKYAVIVAGGKGTRMGAAIPKQYLTLNDKPVLCYAVDAFFRAYDDIRVILVHAKEDRTFIDEVLGYFPERNIMLAEGGDMRFHSVQNGLRLVQEPAVVFVHDGVRPLVSSRLIHACYDQAVEKGIAVPAVALKESIRRIANGENIYADRTAFRAIQTPQTFLSEILLPAFACPYETAFTDEASVVERMGHSIHLVEGEERNIKVTSPADLWLAGRLLSGIP